VPFIVPRESGAVPLIRQNVASGTIIRADESNAWERLHASYDMRRVNHSAEYVGEDGASVNQAESYFSRLRRAERPRRSSPVRNDSPLEQAGFELYVPPPHSVPPLG
jgi:ISXO2-like transposase domain